MRTSRLDRFAALAVVVVLGVVLFESTGTSAAFLASTGNPGNTFTSIPDWKAPIVGQATVRKAEGGIPGYVRASGSYTMIANVVDDPSSNPPAGLGSATGNISTLTTGATAVALSASSQTVAGVAYTHASAAQTVTAGHAAGSFSISVTAADLVSPPNSGLTSFTAVVDNTAPFASTVTASPAVVVTNGGTVNRADAGDTITYLWNEPIDPASIIAGWDGTGSQNVTVNLQNKGSGDSVSIFNSANTLQLPLGVVALKTTDYVTASTNFGGPTNATRSTMTWDSTTGAITVRLGPADATGTVTTATTTSQMVWTPQSAAFDRAGNLSTVTTWTQGTATRKF
jgi:hypothetical protein